MKENINVVEKNIFGISAQPSRQQVYEQKMAIFEQKLDKEDTTNLSQKSSSKYSIPDSENFGEKHFTISTQNNKILDTYNKNSGSNFNNKNEDNIFNAEKVYKGTTLKGGMSIRSIQNKTNQFTTNKLDSINRNDNSHDNSKLNTSQQQAINMYGKDYSGTEAGKRRNSPYSVVNPLPFMGPTNDGSPVSNKNNNFLNNIKNNLNSFGNENLGYGMTTQIPPYFGNGGNDATSMPADVNPMMNSFMMQMMIMQQNAALIQQQHELMRNLGINANRNPSVERNISGSRSRSRPRRFENDHIKIKEDKSFENRSQIERSNFSELNDEEEKGYPENIYDRDNFRAGSASVERKRRFNDVKNTGGQNKLSKPLNRSSLNKRQKSKEKGSFLL